MTLLKFGFVSWPCGMPAGGLQIDFHIAGNGGGIFKLQHGAAKIRPAFGAGKSGMQHADAFSVGYVRSWSRRSR